MEILETIEQNKDKFNESDLIELNKVVRELLESKRTDIKDEISIANDYGNKISVSTNYGNWEICRRKYSNLEKNIPFFFEIEDRGDISGVSLSIKQVEELIAFLNHKINFIKGEEL